MNRTKLVILGLMVSFLAAVGGASAANAVWSPNFNSSDETVTLSKESTHTGSFYAAGDQVTIDGTVTGTLYCAGNTVTINGTVEGDVLCAGQKVTINGTVGQDVRAAGQFVEVNGTVGGSLTAFGQDVRIGSDATVAGDVNGAAQQFTINGTVGRDVAIGTQIFALNNEVKGSVDVSAEEMRLGNEASVVGNLNYGSQNQLLFDESKVGGEVSHNPATDGGHQNNNGHGLMSAVKTMFLLMLAISALAAVLLMPRFLNRSGELFGRQMLMTVLLGFAFVFGGPILVGLLLFSIFLAPIGMALLFGWMAILLFSGIFFAYWVGSELLRSQPNAIIRMLGGVAVVLVLYMLPFINVLTMFAAVIIGSGMIVTTLTNGYRRPRYDTTALDVAPKVKKVVKK